MSALSVRLPESLHRAAREVAAQDGVSINQLIASALGEKIAALKTVEFLRERGQGADASDLAAVLALVPDAQPPIMIAFRRHKR
jgi:hypothetical protein